MADGKDTKEKEQNSAVIVSLSVDSTASSWSATTERHMETTRVKRFDSLAEAKQFFKQFESQVFSAFE